MLNPQLDIAALRDDFAKTGRIRIRNALAADVAEALAAEIVQLPYQLFCATGQGIAVIDLDEMARWDRERQAELRRTLTEAASRAEGFAYLGYRMTEAWTKETPATALGRFHTAFKSRKTMETVQQITNAATFDNLFAQATQYQPGHYLTRHLDDPRGEHRKFAFVLGLTKKWDPDWGGLLQFFDTANQPTEAFSPGFNTLDLFDVRHVHSVTFMTPFCLHPRFAISGWFVKGDPLQLPARSRPGAT